MGFLKCLNREPFAGEDEFGEILRERVGGHMLTLRYADGSLKNELLNAYHCLGELGTVAGLCGYPELEGEVNGYILEVEQEWDFLGGF